jgi:hypothetical protein
MLRQCLVELASYIFTVQYLLNYRRHFPEELLYDLKNLEPHTVSESVSQPVRQAGRQSVS